jgi:8-oxo-dGTP pyrophosphatase MutT (NUDIX family)
MQNMSGSNKPSNDHFKPIPVGDERTLGRGRIFELVDQDYKIGSVTKRFETARRAPGVRVIVRDSAGRYLLIREYRVELNDYDLRLPGGKVEDHLDVWERRLTEVGDAKALACEAGRRELLEETGIETVGDLQYVDVARCGATVKWDLYYFEARASGTSFDGSGQESGELIQPLWMTAEDMLTSLLDGNMKEHRSVGVLVPYIWRNEKRKVWENIVRSSG